MTLSSLVQAASIFPQSVAKCAQRTWAILSRYDTIPNFIDYARKADIRTRRYDGVQTFTCDLLDMHMEFKTNIQMLTHTMGHMDQYIVSEKEEQCISSRIGDEDERSIPLDIAALVLERRALKREMAKLVKVIEELCVPNFIAPPFLAVSCCAT